MSKNGKLLRPVRRSHAGHSGGAIANQKFPQPKLNRQEIIDTAITLAEDRGVDNAIAWCMHCMIRADNVGKPFWRAVWQQLHVLKGDALPPNA